MLLNHTFVSSCLVEKFARHRRARQRYRLVRLTVVYNHPRQPGRARPLAAYRNSTAAMSTGKVLCIGGYLIGDEHCPWLYGPTDVRY